MIRRSSGELVAAHLRRMVFEGDYRPGDRVRQDELAAELGVSRIPVREALIALEREGWVRVEPHRGAFVRGIDADYVRDHYAMYGLIFGLMAERLVQRGDDEGRARVRAAAEAVAEAGPDDPRTFNVRNREFLGRLEVEARAPRLTSIARVMTSLVPGNFFRTIPGAAAVQRAGVAEVASAVDAVDGAGAAAAFRALLTTQAEQVVDELARLGTFAAPGDRPSFVSPEGAVDRRSSGELVAAHLRRLIVTGDYRPGERVRQDEIAVTLGVSRIPVREALIALEREGWVRVEPHRGAFVNGLDADFVLDHFELHGAISGLTAARAVERADDATMAEVVTAGAAVVDAEGVDAEAFNTLVYRFVDDLDRAAAAPRLSSITRVLANLVPGNYFAEVPAAVAIQRDHLGRIVPALERRDADGAVEEYAAMLQAHGAALAAVLTERGLFDPPGPATGAAVG